MKARNSIEITVCIAGCDYKMRIAEKRSRYLQTRYWVMVPGVGTRPDRWRMEPSIEAAVHWITRWLTKKSHSHFLTGAASQSGASNTGDSSVQTQNQATEQDQTSTGKDSLMR